MATKKKAAKKKAAPKKKSPIYKAKEQPPVRVIVEVLVKNEATGAGAFTIAAKPLADTDAAPAHNFSFVLNPVKCTVLSLVVEHRRIDNPPNTGSFFTPVLDPNDPQQVRVIIVARQDFPGCSGTLSLKFNGKDVFANPEPIAFSGGMGKINKLVNLPK